MARSKRGSTTEAAKTEAVTVRISPQARWALELMSRQMHKPLSGVFEWCVDVASRLVEVDSDEGRAPIHQLAKETGGSQWQRAMALFHQAPSLLTHEERAFVDAIARSPELRYMPEHAEDAEYITPRGVVSEYGDELFELATERVKAGDKSPIAALELAEIKKRKK